MAVETPNRKVPGWVVGIVGFSMLTAAIVFDKWYLQTKNEAQAAQLAPFMAPKEFKLGPTVAGCMDGLTIVRIGTGTHDTYFYRLTPEGKPIPCQ